MDTAVKKQSAAGLSSALIMPFVNSTISVFTTMVKVKPTIVKPTLKEDNSATFDVSGVIGFSGEVVGSVVLSFQMDVASKLVNSLVGCDIEPGSSDFIDAVGELANMVAGSAKKDLGKVASIAVPTVILGKDHMIGRLSGTPCFLIPCHTPFGDFAVEVNIKVAA